MKLFIPIICYNHTANTEFMFSLMQLLIALKHNNIETVFFPINFDSLISRARNAAAAHFLTDKTATHLLFIDSDIEFKPDDVFNLINANKPVICAAYAQKWLDQNAIKTHFSKPTIPFNPFEICTKTSVHLLPADKVDYIMKVKYATTGFLLVQRHVFETIANNNPTLSYINDIDGYSSANSDCFYNFFPTIINPDTKRYESEDYGFSRLWTESGGEIFVATNISLKHHGWFAYPANLYRQLTE